MKKLLIMLLLLSCTHVASASAIADGYAAYNKQDYATAIKHWRSGAELGEAGAQSALGYMYSAGLGVRQDYKEANRLYKLAAEQGEATAQSNLGINYYSGLGTEKDQIEAVRWFRLAANNGNVAALLQLASMYAAGEGGVRRDHTEAYNLYKAAAERGDSSAQLRGDLSAKI